jgi:hypothetical protein
MRSIDVSATGKWAESRPNFTNLPVPEATILAHMPGCRQFLLLSQANIVVTSGRTGEMVH